jgi:hypothetical protein
LFTDPSRAEPAMNSSRSVCGMIGSQIGTQVCGTS